MAELPDLQMDVARYWQETTTENYGKSFPLIAAVRLYMRHGLRNQLIFELAPQCMEVFTNPTFHLTVGHRRFRVIEEIPVGDLDDGLFGERRAAGDAHQSF